MNRNFAMEKRIKDMQDSDILHKINSYGGMGMGTASPNEKKIRLEEIDYIEKHPEIYKKDHLTIPQCISSI